MLGEHSQCSMHTKGALLHWSEASHSKFYLYEARTDFQIDPLMRLHPLYAPARRAHSSSSTVRTHKRVRLFTLDTRRKYQSSHEARQSSLTGNGSLRSAVAGGDKVCIDTAPAAHPHLASSAMSSQHLLRSSLCHHNQHAIATYVSSENTRGKSVPRTRPPRRGSLQRHCRRVRPPLAASSSAKPMRSCLLRRVKMHQIAAKIDHPNDSPARCCRSAPRRLRLPTA